MLRYIVVNNWFLVVDVNVSATNSMYYALYFLVFYYFGVLVGVNIVISFAIDMYGAVERLDNIHQ